jgi:tetratricopeptide (TPR) repeat protein
MTWSEQSGKRRVPFSFGVALFVMALLSVTSVAGVAGGQTAQPPLTGVISGTVRNAAGEPVSAASVRLQPKDRPDSTEVKTSADGSFQFPGCAPGTYLLRAEKAGSQRGPASSVVLAAGERKRVDLVLPSGPAGEMEFDDKPNFTVAGVTDSTSFGGHGSDVRARTSEALAKDTLTLKSDGSAEATSGTTSAAAASESEKKLRAALVQSPSSFDANHQLGEFCLRAGQYQEAIPLLEAAYRINPADHTNSRELAEAYAGNGDLTRARAQARKTLTAGGLSDAATHSLLGDLDERVGDPLEAVKEYEQAAQLDPNERNYFEWGAELLLHKAALPAVEVFSKGNAAHPDSARMLAGLGAALYASGSYDEAARRLCDASDLSPADPAPYLFLGRMEKTSAAPLACSEERLARFVRDQPGNALGNYYYALALWKGDRGSGHAGDFQQAVTLLEKAVAIDPKLGEAYVQLGNVYSDQGDSAKAMEAYQKATEASPNLGEAHYRLSLAYKRAGNQERAHQEFQAYEQIEKTEAAEVERQRRELRQFLIILKGQLGSPQN